MDGEFDETGGRVSFRYVNASLTMPRNLTDEMQAIRMYCMKEENIEMKLNDSEFLVSGVLKLESNFNGVLKSPAMLEIRCDVLVSRVESFFELCMIQYDPVSKTWIDVEKCSSIQRRFCEWNNSLELFVLFVVTQMRANEMTSNSLLHVANLGYCILKKTRRFCLIPFRLLVLVRNNDSQNKATVTSTSSFEGIINLHVIIILSLMLWVYT